MAGAKVVHSFLSMYPSGPIASLSVPVLIPNSHFLWTLNCFHASMPLSTLPNKFRSSCKDPAPVSPPFSLRSDLQAWPCLLWAPQLPQSHRMALPLFPLPWRYLEVRLSCYSTDTGEGLWNEWVRERWKPGEEMLPCGHLRSLPCPSAHSDNILDDCPSLAG